MLLQKGEFKNGVKTFLLVGSMSYRHLPRLPSSPDDPILSSSSTPSLPMVCGEADDQISDLQESGRARLQLPPINLGLNELPVFSLECF